MRVPLWGLKAVVYKLYLQLNVFKLCAIIPQPVLRPEPAVDAVMYVQSFIDYVLLPQGAMIGLFV